MKGNMTEEQFSGAVVKYRQNLVDHAYSILKDWDDAEDAVQDALIRLNNRRDAYDPAQAAVYSWMATSVLNRSRTIIERRKHRLETEQSLNPDEDENIASVETDGMIQLDVAKAINSLPLEERMAIKMFYIEGLTIAEIAKVCKVTTRTIDRRLDKGRDKIGVFLRDYDPSCQSSQIVPSSEVKSDTPQGNVV